MPGVTGDESGRGEGGGWGEGGEELQGAGKRWKEGRGLKRKGQLRAPPPPPPPPPQKKAYLPHTREDDTPNTMQDRSRRWGGWARGECGVGVGGEEGARAKGRGRRWARGGGGGQGGGV